MQLTSKSTIHLACGVSLDAGCATALSGFDDEHRPGVLVSFAHWKNWAVFRSKNPDLTIGSFVIDSGAFTAFNIGKKIELNQYAEHIAIHPHDWALNLDVIGDAAASTANLESLWAMGREVVPVFHVGTPFSVIKDMTRTFPKIAIGGMVGMNTKTKLGYCREVFAHAWPARLHALGIGSEPEIMAFPWHSVDSSSWQLQPQAFGKWKQFGHLSANRANHQTLPLKSQVDWYMKIERKHNQVWRRELSTLAALPKERIR